MGRCYYRCSRCRTRNTFRQPVKSYIRLKRCRSCGHTHFYVDKERRDRKSCGCLGSYWWGRTGGARPTASTTLTANTTEPCAMGRTQERLPGKVSA